MCLNNQPSASDAIGKAECGNGRLDEGEQCDCGKPEVELNLRIRTLKDREPNTSHSHALEKYLFEIHNLP